jgi:hypothetical protein
MGARGEDGTAKMDWAQGAIGFVLAGLLLAILGEFAIAPHIVARHDPAFWHTAGTAAYGVQWICALTVLWKLSSRP